jgi:hypothetical protein
MPSCPRCGAEGAAWVPGADDTDWCRMCGHVDYKNPVPASELKAIREPQFRGWDRRRSYGSRKDKSRQERRRRARRARD